MEILTLAVTFEGLRHKILERMVVGGYRMVRLGDRYLVGFGK